MFSMVRSARALGLGLAAAATFGATSASAYTVINRFGQPERIGYDGRYEVEASMISVINCNGAGEHGGQFWIYQYTNRAGYRAILPPHWANALGGKDWPTFQEAATVACLGVAIAPPKTKPKATIDHVLAGHHDDGVEGGGGVAPPLKAKHGKGLSPVGPANRGRMAGGGEDHHHY
jgi:hypothetical protein